MAATRARKPKQSKASWADIIATVQTPLGFFSLIVLVVEVIFGSIAATSTGTDRTYLLIGMIALIFSLVIIVAMLAVFRPESLQGKRPTQDVRATPSPAQVVTVSKPQILCAATVEFEELGFAEDVAIIERSFGVKVTVEHNLTASRLRTLLSTNKFDLVHLLSFIEPASGAVRFGSGEILSTEGFASLIELCGAKLVILASCDSIDLAARMSRIANIIAATAVIGSHAFVGWAECFYSLLSRGQPLSAAYHIARTTTDVPMVLLMKNDMAFG